jgi:hypothetical protein
MYRLTAQRMEVIGKHLLDVDQRALTWTVAPVLKSGNRDGVALIHIQSNNRFSN